MIGILKHLFKFRSNRRQDSGNHYMAGLEKVWTFVDGLPEKDYEVLLAFLENDNSALPIDESDLKHSGHVYAIENAPFHQYKLKERFFEAIQYSYRKYGWISHNKKSVEHKDSETV